MKIYLGGKMSGHGRGANWRTSLVSGVRAEGDFGEEYGNGDGINLYAGCGQGDPPTSWPILPNAILGCHDYVGPYLVACDHGCFHTGDHASSVGWDSVSGFIDENGEIKGNERAIANREKARQQIGRLCLRAMMQADLLFFWIDTLDAYGTLAELVCAKTLFDTTDVVLKERGAAALDKKIIVATHSFAAIDQMWLAFHLVGTMTCIEASTPKKALDYVLADLQIEAELSPIEKMFFDRWRAIYGFCLLWQYEVPGFRYRLDFAFPQQKVAIELDGYQYHSSKEQFTNDRKRQRELEMAGWRFVRFSGSEINKNLDACISQAYEFWQAVKEGVA